MGNQCPWGLGAVGAAVQGQHQCLQGHREGTTESSPSQCRGTRHGALLPALAWIPCCPSVRLAVSEASCAFPGWGDPVTSCPCAKPRPV